MSSFVQGFINLITDLCEDGKLDPKTSVVVDFNQILEGEILKVIDRLGFCGVICSEQYRNLLLGSALGRIGFFKTDGGWSFPNVRAKSIIVLGNHSDLGGKRLFSLLANGVKVVHILAASNPSSCQTHAVGFLVYRYLLYRTSSIIQSKLQGLTNLIPASFHQPVFSWASRREAAQFISRIPHCEIFSIPRRILLVNNGLAPGGAERQFVNTALALRARGCDVQIVVLKSGDSYFDFYRSRIPSDIPIFNIFEFAFRPVEGNQGESSALKAIHDLVDNHKGGILALPRDDIMCFVKCFLFLKPSVVHTWQDSTNISAGVAALLLNVGKIVLSTRNMAPYRFGYYQSYMGPLYSAILKQRNVVMTNNSRAGAYDYEKWLKLSAGSVPVILNGVNFSTVGRERATAEFRSKFDLRESDHVVGSIFRFWPEKDPQLWISVVTIVARAVPNVRFLLVGEGPLKDEILDMASQNDVVQFMVLTGYLKDPIPAYLSMDVFLLTSKYEGTPNVLIEAQMAGVPAVTTDAGGCRDIIEEDRTGFVVADRNAQELAAKVVWLIENRQKRIEMGTRAENFAREKFGIGRMCDRMLGLYFDEQF
jgi:glycosyltransferase involved in cell wall biosynthesis